MDEVRLIQATLPISSLAPQAVTWQLIFPPHSLFLGYICIGLANNPCSVVRYMLKPWEGRSEERWSIGEAVTEGFSNSFLRIIAF